MFNSANVGQLGQIHCPYKSRSICRRPHCRFNHIEDQEFCNDINKYKTHNSKNDTNNHYYQQHNFNQDNDAMDDESSNMIFDSISSKFGKYNSQMNSHDELPKISKASEHNIFQQPKILNENKSELDSKSSHLAQNHINNFHVESKSFINNDQTQIIQNNFDNKRKSDDNTFDSKIHDINQRSANLPLNDLGYEISDHCLSRKKDISQVCRIKMRLKLFKYFNDFNYGSESINLAEQNEAYAFDISNNRLSYLHNIQNLIKKMKKNSQISNDGDSSSMAIECKKMISNSRNSSMTKYLPHCEKYMDKIKSITKLQLYLKFLDCVASIDELQENGYPCELYDRETKKNIISIRNTRYNNHFQRDSSLNENEEICLRCNKRFMIIKSLDEISEIDCCLYHPKQFVQRISAHEPTKLLKCCGQSPNSPGCKHAIYHVFHGSPQIDSFEQLIKRDDQNASKTNQNIHSSMDVSQYLALDDSASIFAMDCEMVYTVRGYELGRVTLVDSMFCTIIDSFIKVSSDIIDCNSEFSGLTISDIENANETLHSIRMKLQDIFSKPRTPPILVGHSLENDLICLKLHYNYIIDTSLVQDLCHESILNDISQKNDKNYKSVDFQKKSESFKSLPNYSRVSQYMKPSLQKLVQKNLGKLIQHDNSGHDSYEDACAALDLIYCVIFKDH